MSKFRFDSKFPEALRPEFEGMCAEFEWLIPAWCHRVTLFFDGNGESPDEAASVAADFSYRFASIFIKGEFLNSAARQKREMFLHEVIHISLAPISNYARNTIKSLLLPDAPKFNEHAQEALRSRVEGATQDFAVMLMDKLYPQ